MGKMIQIDGERLSEILEERKLKKSQVAQAMGYNDGFMSVTIRRNQINVGAAKMLETLYAIPLDEYKYVEPEQPVGMYAEPTIEAAPVAVIPQSGMTEDDWNRIAGMITATAVDYDKIEKAVAEGVVEAMHTVMTIEPVTRQIQQMLYAAIKGALAKIANERK